MSWGEVLLHLCRASNSNPVHAKGPEPRAKAKASYRVSSNNTLKRDIILQSRKGWVVGRLCIAGSRPGKRYCTRKPYKARTKDQIILSILSISLSGGAHIPVSGRDISLGSSQPSICQMQNPCKHTWHKGHLLLVLVASYLHASSLGLPAVFVLHSRYTSWNISGRVGSKEERTGHQSATELTMQVVFLALAVHLPFALPFFFVLPWISRILPLYGARFRFDKVCALVVFVPLLDPAFGERRRGALRGRMGWCHGRSA